MNINLRITRRERDRHAETQSERHRETHTHTEREIDRERERRIHTLTVIEYDSGHKLSDDEDGWQSAMNFYSTYSYAHYDLTMVSIIPTTVEKPATTGKFLCFAFHRRYSEQREIIRNSRSLTENQFSYYDEPLCHTCRTAPM